MREVLYVLQSIDSREVIESFIMRQDINGCVILMNTLRYTDEETESRWSQIYSELFKY
jgi:hypothetical protein